MKAKEAMEYISKQTGWQVLRITYINENLRPAGWIISVGGEINGEGFLASDYTASLEKRSLDETIKFTRKRLVKAR
jgi:hypothetical protein